MKMKNLILIFIFVLFATFSVINGTTRFDIRFRFDMNKPDSDNKSTSGIQSNSDIQSNIFQLEWNEFKKKYSKNYANDAEDNLRFKCFLENKYKIMKHNARYDQGRASNSSKAPSFKLGLNKYSDMLSHEIVSKMNGYKSRPGKINSTFHLRSHNVAIPDELDWRNYNYVTDVKDQKQCGSCWAFSSTGALEGQTSRKFGQLISLSEQNLVDCSGNYGNNGCNGGMMQASFEYIRDNNGIDTEDSYPYEAQQGGCRYDENNRGASDNGPILIQSGDESALLEAVASVGPISIAIDASHGSFQQYSEGVYDEPDCSSNELDHGVLVVGYGTDEETGKKYWLVKNSWGTSWGENGYIKMVRDNNNQCGISTDASYPSV